MTSKISLFDFGIYKMTVKRLKWGSVAYFALLFLTCVLPCILNKSTHYSDGDVLEHQGAYVISTIFSIGVSIAVSLLVFRPIHSKKQTVFIGSLPIKREAFYVSSLLGAFTLTAIPYVLNAAIVAILNLFGKTAVGAGDIFLWAAFGFCTVFVMLSVAVLSSVITGNSFMAVFLYGFINVFLLAFAGMIELYALLMISGYPSDTGIIRLFAEYIPISKVCLLFASPEGISHFGFEHVIYLAGAAVLYIISGFVFKIRKSEKAENVTAFDFMNPILKYALTLFSVSLVTLICINGRISTVAYAVLSVFISVLVYFGCEMILKKSIKIFRSSYRGYIGLALVCTFALVLIIMTGFFGYSSYVPDKSDIKSVGISNAGIEYLENAYGKNLPCSYEKNAKEYVLNLHKDMQNKDFKPFDFSGENDIFAIYIYYTLNDGSTVFRKYPTESYEEENKYIARLYDENNDFKYSYNNMLRIDENDISYIQCGEGEIYDRKIISEFVRRIKEECENMSFSDFYGTSEIYEGRPLYIVQKDKKAIMPVDAACKDTIEWVSRYCPEPENETITVKN